MPPLASCGCGIHDLFNLEPPCIIVHRAYSKLNEIETGMKVYCGEEVGGDEVDMKVYCGEEWS